MKSIANNIFAKKTLRVRLTAWYIMLLAITLIVFSGYLYLQLDDSLLVQVDTALQLTASQFAQELIEKNGTPVFRENPDMASRFSQAGIALRLIDNQGKVWDGFGNYENLPLLIPKTAGYLNLKGNETIWRVYSFPLRENYWLEVAESLKPVYEASSHLLVLMLWGFPLVLIFTALVGFWLAQVALSPLERMIRTAEAINDNDLSQRIGYRGVEDEVGRLASTIDRMLDRLEAAFQHERRFTADAAHELRTPLTIIKGRIGVTLSRQRSEAEYISTLQELEQEADRLIRLTNGLLFLARLEQAQKTGLQFQEVDLSSLLLTLVEQMQPIAEGEKIDLRTEILQQLWLNGNPDYLTNLFLNLLDNALKYTDQGGQVLVKAKQNSTGIEVIFQDTGEGIETEHLPSLFDRFYRVEKARSRCTGGTGLGLAIASEIARLHGGTLSVESEVNHGTTFRLVF